MNRAGSAGVGLWRQDVLERAGSGQRFAGLYGTAEGDACRLSALFPHVGGVDLVSTRILPDPDGRLTYASLTPEIPSAFWYERALHDLSGVVPLGHPRLDPLLLPRGADDAPRPGRPGPIEPLEVVAESRGPTDVTGRGVFVLPVGPVRSGVAESVEFLLETPGEDIPHLNIRPHFKHRGIAKRFEGLDASTGVLVAERVEGIASVGHALAFCHAAEALAEAAVPPRAGLIRVVYAELERIANHLDVAFRLAEAAGLAVANSRFSWHKESVMRLVSAMSGSRFGRGVVVPGGVARDLLIPAAEAEARLIALHARIADDAKRAMRTPSFLDRLRGTGVLSEKYAATWGLLGPVGRASGSVEDARWSRPTDAYAALRLPPEPATDSDGDVQARLRVRWEEIDVSVALVVAALRRLGAGGGDPGLRVDAPFPDGTATAVGWAEAPHGEVLYAIMTEDGRIARCFARSPSLHNLVAFHDAFGRDVFTDFAFIEASFGLSYAGVAM